MPERVLIIEDDLNLAEIVSQLLGEMGFIVESVDDGVKGVELAVSGAYSLILLDLMLPSLHGVEVCKRIRAKVQVPIVILTSSDNETEKILCLELGADDYITKPFRAGELKARIKAILRRRSHKGESEVPDMRFEKLLISSEKRKVFYDEEEKQLTAREFDILLFLAGNPGRVYSREQIATGVFGYESEERSISVLVNRIRAKVEPNPSHPIFIKTIQGVGYSFADDLESTEN